MKHYTRNDICRQINWVDYKKLDTFLAENGIEPATMFSTGGKQYRLYSEAAYKQAVALRAARDKVKAKVEATKRRGRPPLQQSSLTGKQVDDLVSTHDEVAALRGDVARANAEIAVLSGDMKALHAKIDSLLTELSGVQVLPDNKQHVNGAALTA